MTSPYLAIPTISGTAFVDQTLTASASATGDPAPTISYQWQSSSDGDTWTDISGATSSTYVLASEDEGNLIRVQVVATNSEGSDTQISESIGPVEIEPVAGQLYAKGKGDYIGSEFEIVEDFVPYPNNFSWYKFSLKAGPETPPGYIGISEGNLYSWGTNTEWGLLGLGDTDDYEEPTQVGSSGYWEDISIGYDYCLAIRAGRLYAWGKNNENQLGLEPPLSKEEWFEEVNLQQPTNSSQWSVAESLLGPNQPTDELFTDWPNDSYSILYIDEQYGIYEEPFLADRLAPVQISADTGWEAVYAGGFGSLAYAIRDGELYSWGVGGSAQPTRVGDQTGWQMVSTNSGNTLGIRDGRLYAWGSNNFWGELGTGDTESYGEPVQIGSSTDWQFVKTFNQCSFGIRSGYLYAWGFNLYNALGIGLPEYLSLEEWVIEEDLDIENLLEEDYNRWLDYYFDQVRELSPAQVGSASDWQYVTRGLITYGIRGGTIYSWGTLNEEEQQDNFDIAIPISETGPVIFDDTRDWSQVYSESQEVLLAQTASNYIPPPPPPPGGDIPSQGLVWHSSRTNSQISNEGLIHWARKDSQ